MLKGPHVILPFYFPLALLCCNMLCALASLLAPDGQFWKLILETAEIARQHLFLQIILWKILFSIQMLLKQQVGFVHYTPCLLRQIWLRKNMGSSGGCAGTVQLGKRSNDNLELVKLLLGITISSFMSCTTLSVWLYFKTSHNSDTFLVQFNTQSCSLRRSRLSAFSEAGHRLQKVSDIL